MPDKYNGDVSERDSDRDRNPLELLAIEPWFLKQMDGPEKARKFLLDIKKHMIAAYHPDNCDNELYDSIYEEISKRLSLAYTFVQDPQKFRQCLDELRTGGPSLQKLLGQREAELKQKDLDLQDMKTKLAHAQEYGKAEIERLKEEGKKLAEANKYKKQTVLNMFSALRNHELSLVYSRGEHPIGRGLNGEMEFYFLAEEDNRAVTDALGRRIDLSDDTRIEIESREALFTLLMGIKTGERMDGSKPNKQENYERSPFAVRVDKGDFVLNWSTPRSRHTETFEILGSISHLGIRKYLDCNEKTFSSYGYPEPKGVNSESSGLFLESTTFADEFFFRPTVTALQQNLIGRISPFMAPFLLRYTPTLVRRSSNEFNLGFKGYNIIVPTSFKQTYAKKD
jgi:hypothetical protein